MTSLVDRFRNSIVKAVETDAIFESPLRVEDPGTSARCADDKERLVGLIAAPLAAVIGILVISALISNDPSAVLKNGQIDELHVNPSLYEGLVFVLLGLSVLLLMAALFRKRLLLGIVMALYGLAIFNLHYFGFGIPFILGGAWLLVRAYRLQRDFREFSKDQPSPVRGAVTLGTSRPESNRHFTPPASARKS